MKTYWDSSALVEALHDTAMRARIKKPDHATRPHALPEVFSTLTKGVNYRYPPADAANMLGDLVKDLEFVELDATETLAAIKSAQAQGVKGARIHDLMHATAADKFRAGELLTLDPAGFMTLKSNAAPKAP